MPEQFTEVSSQGWLSRIGESIKGVLFGIAIFALAFPLLWWNEGRSVRTYKSLKEGAGAVVSVSADSVSPTHEGALVHVTGRAITDETLTDPSFGITVPALRLRRNVKMYQWVEKVETETETRAGGKKVTTKRYSYAHEWNDSLIKSADFEHPEGHQNPDTMPYNDDSWEAGRVTLGAFELSAGLKGQIANWATVPIVEDALAPGIRDRFQLRGEELYMGPDPSTPVLGDLRVDFEQVAPTAVSVVARQSGTGLSGYQTNAGDVLEMLELGDVAAAQMFTAAQQANKTLTWILRLVGFVMMAFGIGLVFRPLRVVADVIPLIGDIVGMGAGFIAIVLAAPFTLLTIAAAWLFYRPVLGVALILVSIAIVVQAKRMAMRRRAAKAA